VDFKNYQKSSVIVPELVAITHFQKAFEGNGIDHMNINLVSFPIIILRAADQLGVFDGRTWFRNKIINRAHKSKIDIK
jgi:hypothetical protein